MNNKIIRLDPLTINKIAAGEVIERPASVVKELVENSIDAKSDSISIVVEDGGKKLIEVTDNGMGMSHEDAILAIERHTTSKISTAADLFNIATLGFRGEALASIVSVAVVDIITKTKESELGTHLRVEGGKITINEQISAPVGTRVSVKNLFYNVPVRRKFLKSTTTEFNHISEYVTKLALSHSEVSVTLKHNGKSIIAVQKGNLLSRIAMIFGNTIAKGCIKIQKSKETYSVNGYIAKPELSRKSRDYLYIFVNSRPIASQLITDAVLSGYGTSIPDKRYPVVFLFLEVPPQDIDVNIHPTKREVKFSKESLVYSLIQSAVKEGLEEAGLSIFEKIAPTHKTPTVPLTTYQSLTQKKAKSKATSLSSSVRPKLKSTVVRPSTKSQIQKQIATYVKSDITPKKEIQAYTKEEQTYAIEDIRVLGIINDVFIVAETSRGLLLCDQHAAHEKINYLKYLNQLKSKKVSVQQLLAPIVVDIKPTELELFKKIHHQLKLFGFDMEIFGKREIAIRTVPTILGRNLSATLAKDILDIFKENYAALTGSYDFTSIDVVKDLIALLSCKRSIKAGDKITLEQASKLIKELLSLDDPYTCPHGRPTIIILNNDYLEELFQRDYRT
ncbi:MAG: DNA mismatch repair endonuclease MutL [Candidatus Heimdallarchaeaceae archaeon]